MQTKEIEEVEEDFATYKAQLASLEKRALLSEIDYRELPDEMDEIIKVGMGGSALRDLLLDVDLDELIETLQTEVEEAAIVELLTCPLIEIFGDADIASLNVEIILTVSEPFTLLLMILSVKFTVGGLVSNPFNCDADRTLL